MLVSSEIVKKFLSDELAENIRWSTIPVQIASLDAWIAVEEVSTHPIIVFRLRFQFSVHQLCKRDITGGLGR